MVKEKCPEVPKGTLVAEFFNFERTIIDITIVSVYHGKRKVSGLSKRNLGCRIFHFERTITRYYNCVRIPMVKEKCPEIIKGTWVVEFSISKGTNSLLTLQLCPCTMVKEQCSEIPKGTLVVDFYNFESQENFLKELGL